MKSKILSSVNAFAIVLVLLCFITVPARADVITVTNTNDSGPGSLRQALADANDGDTITFAVTDTIGLTSGELLVNSSITISGPGANNLAVNGNAKSRVFHVASGKTVTISGLAITNGNSGSVAGGGIYNDHATLTLNECTVTGNSASFTGGGIFNDGLTAVQTWKSTTARLAATPRWAAAPEAFLTMASAAAAAPLSK